MVEIGNMDKTPVWLKMHGESIYTTKDDNEVSVSSTGHEK